MTRTSLLLDLVGLLALSIAFALGQWAAEHVPLAVRVLLYALGAAALIGSLLHQALSRSSDMSTRPQRRRMLRGMLPAGVGYIAAVAASMLLLRQVDAPVLRAAVALLPVPFVALMLRAMIRYIREADEMQRRIEIEAVCVAAALVSLGYLAAGLLQAARVVDIPSSLAMICVFPLISLVYGVAKLVVAGRYA